MHYGFGCIWFDCLYVSRGNTAEGRNLSWVKEA